MKVVLTLLFSFICGSIYAQLPSVSSGTIKRINSFPSKFVDARNVDIWLPEGYTPKKKYAVLYMHDGQMLFDRNTTWNKQAWEVDDVLAKLISENKISDVIVVGVWNGGKTRHADYFPQKPFESLTLNQKEYVTKKLKSAGRITESFKPVSDNYLKFLVTEVKPFIDKNYATYTGPQHTFIAGSSMGGLISMYAICEYPNIFGGAVCMSTHWPGIFAVEDNPIPGAFINYLEKHLPSPVSHKIYFDYGDRTLDAMYPQLQKKVDEVMVSKGFTEKNWISKFFPGDDHSERSWTNRLDIPMLFLLEK